MSTVDEIREDLLAALDEISADVDWIEDNGPAVIDTLLSTFISTYPLSGPLVNPIADRAKSALADGVREARTLLVIGRLEVRFMGSPDTLRQAAEAIDQKVIVPARDLAGDLVRGKIPSSLPSNYTDGEASEAYVAAIDGRDAAVREVETYASPISSGLRELADGIEDYYTSLRDLFLQLGQLVLSIVVTITTWETIVGGVLGIIGIIISLVQLGFTISDLVGGTDQTVESVASSFETDVPPWPAVLA